MKNKVRLCFTVMLLCHAGLPAQAAEDKAGTSNPIYADTESLTLGKALYVKECLSCHGATGRGDGPGAAYLEQPVHDLTTSDVQAQSDGTLFWKTTIGRRPMPSYKKLLTKEERWHVINYLRSLARNDESS